MLRKSQAELDAAVIEAAGSLDREWNARGYTPSSHANILSQAVRARREAMRPHKLALVTVLVLGGSSLGDEEVMKLWGGYGAVSKKRGAEWLARILDAPDAPDEPKEDRE